MWEIISRTYLGLSTQAIEGSFSKKKNILTVMEGVSYLCVVDEELLLYSNFEDVRQLDCLRGKAVTYPLSQKTAQCTKHSQAM